MDIGGGGGVQDQKLYNYEEVYICILYIQPNLYIYYNIILI